MTTRFDSVGHDQPSVADFVTELNQAGLTVSVGPGILGWSAELEELFCALERALTALGRSRVDRVLRFPPVLDRRVLERSGFAASFPQLFGSVHAFTGDRHDNDRLQRAMAEGADWSDAMASTDFVLTPAACYPVYPCYEGLLAAPGVAVDVTGFCFRHEPSTEPGRLVSFRQREFVRIGDPLAAQHWFADWQLLALEFVSALGLAARLAVAADPFFGPGGRLLASGQRERNLKFEVLVPIGRDHPVAVASCNQHLDHFGTAFGIRTEDGAPAHTSCVGFGMERLALALVAAHGPDIGCWPEAVRERLWS